MQNKYVIKIELKDGSEKYLKVSDPYHRSTLIRSKNVATKVDSYPLAELISDWFWNNKWDKELYNTREVVRVIGRPR